MIKIYPNPPFEYKYQHAKQSSNESGRHGFTFDYTKPVKDPFVNFSSPASCEHRSKMKNLKNSSKLNQMGAHVSSMQNKQPIKISNENLVTRQGKVIETPRLLFNSESERALSRKSSNLYGKIEVTLVVIFP